MSSSKFTGSDSLAIALACIGGIVAIILFLVEKTPGVVVLALLAMLGLSVYPILHFALRPKTRVMSLAVVFVCIVTFAIIVWPKKTVVAKSGDTWNTTQPGTSQATTPPMPVPSPKRLESRKEAPRNKGNTGGNSIQQQGKNNIAQFGNNNQATINEAPPDREWKPTQEQLAMLSSQPKRIHIYSVQGDNESAQLASKIAEIVDKNGWEVVRFGVNSYAGVPPQGIWITSKTEDDSAAAILRKALSPIPVGKNIAPEMTDDWGIVLVVGINRPLGKSFPIPAMATAGPYRH